MDCATTNRPGARFGPSAIRDASLMLTDGFHPKWGNNPKNKIVDWGDIPISNSDTQKSIQQITEHLNAYPLFCTEKPHLVALGGDHAVTLGILRSLHKEHGKMAVVHFDAHSDCSPDHLGDPIGHGTWLRNVIDEGLVDPTKVVSMGIRAPVGLKTRHFLSDQGGTTFNAREAMFMGPHEITRFIYEKIGFDTPVYLSFDVDGLDPSQAPGTGTPEIAGLTTMFCLETIELLKSLNWIGMDVVEVSPPYDLSQITALAAATVAWTYICMIDSKNE